MIRQSKICGGKHRPSCRTNCPYYQEKRLSSTIKLLQQILNQMNDDCNGEFESWLKALKRVRKSQLDRL